MVSDIDRHTPQESHHLRAGFPASLADDVDLVRRIMPVPPVAKSKVGQSVRLSGETITLLYRQHYDPLERFHLDGFTPRQRMIFDCIYSRHTSGHVRERSLRQILNTGEPWVRPYVVAPLGDHVIEVAGVAAAERDYILSDEGIAFAADNQDFIALLLARATSFWDCHYRGRFPTRGDFPPFAVLSQLSLEIKGHSRPG